MKLVHIFNHPHRQIDSFSNVNEWNSLHAEWSHETDSKLPVLGLVSPRHLGRVEIRRMVFLCKMKDDNTVRANSVNKFWADVRKPLLFSAAAMSLVLFYFKRILVQFSITIGHSRLKFTIGIQVASCFHKRHVHNVKKWNEKKATIQATMSKE